MMKLRNIFRRKSRKNSSVSAGLSGPAPLPLARAYAHSDAKQPRPLLDALAKGFGAVEADIWLVNGQLLVGHDLKDLKPHLTFEQVYLKPLLDQARQNNGHINPQSLQSLLLLIDIKS